MCCQLKHCGAWARPTAAEPAQPTQPVASCTVLHPVCTRPTSARTQARTSPLPCSFRTVPGTYLPRMRTRCRSRRPTPDHSHPPRRRCFPPPSLPPSLTALPPPLLPLRMAAYVASGKRIPRRGEVGLSSDQIERFETLVSSSGRACSRRGAAGREGTASDGLVLGGGAGGDFRRGEGGMLSERERVRMVWGRGGQH